MTTHITYCRNCAAMCGLEVTAEDGKIPTFGATESIRFPQDTFASRVWRHVASTIVKTGGFEPIDSEVAMDEIHKKLTVKFAQNQISI